MTVRHLSQQTEFGSKSMTCGKKYNQSMSKKLMCGKPLEEVLLLVFLVFRVILGFRQDFFDDVLYTLKLDPQPQVVVACGLLITKLAPCRLS